MVGCTNVVSTANQILATDQDSTPTSFLIVTNTTFPTSEYSPTPKVQETITPFSQPSQTPTQSPTINTPVSRKCLNILPEIPGGDVYNGSIVLRNYRGIDSDKNSYLFNLKNGIKNVIAGEDIRTPVVSPDGKHYAFIDYSTHQLKIFSYTGSLENSIPSEDWDSLYRWQNNENILIPIPKVLEPGNQDLVHNVEFPVPLLLVNPLSNQRQVLKPDYPEIIRDPSAFFYDGSGTTEYDPQITRVVYSGSLTPPGSGVGDILWDLNGKKKLAEIPNGAYNETPIWSPDGSKFFIYAAPGTFYTVTREGVISEILLLNEYHLGAGYYSWSPDGRYIAFWLFDANRGGSSTIAMLDINAKEIKDFCIPSNIGKQIDANAAHPVWSLDSNDLAIEANIQEDENGKIISRDVIFIDTKKGLAVKLASNLTPSGWLLSK